jgi:predicted dehydrogenase
VRLCYGASYRYLPALLVAREKIRRGDIGEILILREFAIGGRGDKHRGTLSYKHYPKGGPGGSGMGLCDHGVHLVDAFSWLVESPVISVSGRGNISGEIQLPEFLHLRYANGAIAELLYEDGTFSTDLPQEGVFGWGNGWSLGANTTDSDAGSWQSHPGCIHIYGSEGSLRVFYYANTVFWRDARGVRQVRVPDEPFPENFSKQLDAFCAAIRENRETPVPGEIGLEAWRILQQVYSGSNSLVR